MKGYFRQKKKTGGITKSTLKSSSKNKSTKKAISGSDLVQPEDYDAREVVLRQFDMNMAYGPCLGMSRLERWNRAKAFGLNPPEEVGNLLKSGEVLTKCLWDDRM